MNARNAELSRLALLALPDLPLVEAGDDLVSLVLAGLDRGAWSLEDGDVVVLAQKIVSKAEGRAVRLDEVEPSERAREIAAQVHKDPRLVEVILGEARQVIRTKPGVLIVEDRRGLILANAGVDHSNVAQDPDSADEENTVLLLPEDPDASARRLRAGLEERTGARVGVIITDSLGRPWRLGTVGFAIGVAGFPALLDLRGRPDLFGHALRTTDVGEADQVAAAASLLMGQVNEGRPVVVVRGLAYPEGTPDASAQALLRPADEDMFR